MSGAATNTIFLHLEGPLQAWGSRSKFVIRDTDDVPTKSGILGMISCAKGVRRSDSHHMLQRLNTLTMGVRIDRPGSVWSDYHTVGAGVGMLTAEGELKTGAKGTLITRRYYLCDASFLVALQGHADLICQVHEALQAPEWPVFLGRKSCPPARPILLYGKEDGEPLGAFDDLDAALSGRPWRPRFKGDDAPYGAVPRAGENITLDAVLEWRATSQEPHVPTDAEPCQDVAVSFDPPVHHPRYLVRRPLTVMVGEPSQTACPPPPRARANYRNEEYRRQRDRRLTNDHGLCVFCKQPATTVQHITYRRAGGDETPDDLRSLCALCHDAVTMIEYGLGMGLDRINPEERHWREAIITKRNEIIRFRSIENRRRALRWTPPEQREELFGEED